MYIQFLSFKRQHSHLMSITPYPAHTLCLSYPGSINLCAFTFCRVVPPCQIFFSRENQLKWELLNIFLPIFQCTRLRVFHKNYRARWFLSWTTVRKKSLHFSPQNHWMRLTIPHKRQHIVLEQGKIENCEFVQVSIFYFKKKRKKILLLPKNFRIFGLCRKKGGVVTGSLSSS